MPTTTKDDTLARENLLDNLSDGQWHSMTKITRHSGKAFTSAALLKKTIAALTHEGVLRAGNNNSYRMVNPHLEDWRFARNLISTGDKDLKAPRYFGGILEDDGWELAPLRAHDLVHFRAGGDATVKNIQRRIGLLGVANQDSDGLVRISTLYGDDIYTMMKEWGKEDGVDISGVRQDKGARRRELVDLPPRYVSDLCAFYGTFAHTLLRKSKSSVTKHISEADDIQQQIYIWIIHAIQRYDATTSIPFAAYLHSSLQRWVHDLNRKSYGRAAADNELKYARVISNFTAQHGRKPTHAEIAELVNEDESTVREKLASIARVNNLRTQSPLDTEEGNEIPLPAGDNHEEAFQAEVEKTLLSAALTSAALEEFAAPRVTAWLSVYNKTWGDGKMVSNKRAAEQALLEAMRTRVKEVIA